MKLTALVDCNSFYASCERVFRPDLQGRPVVVLSNNDGCIVAMSAEAKRLDIPRGAPLFKVKDRLDEANAVVFSSNYTLYNDLSQRIMSILDDYTPRLEIYSIDEAFMDLSGSHHALYTLSKEIKALVEAHVGIPVSIGLGPSKTLAKIANHIGKKQLNGICIPYAEEWNGILRSVDVRDVWGIGSQHGKRLHEKGIHTAADFILQDEDWVRKNMTIKGLKTLWELKGRPSFTMDENPSPRQGIMNSRSFAHPVTTLSDILEAGADYATGAVEKLRSQGSVCKVINSSITTNYFRTEEMQYSNGKTKVLSHPTSYAPEIIRIVQEQLKEIFREGYKYKKIAVFLTGIEDAKKQQQDLFYQEDSRREAVMKSVEEINQRYGRHTLHCRSRRNDSTWQMKRDHLSPRYTTRWEELPVVRC